MNILNKEDRYNKIINEINIIIDDAIKEIQEVIISYDNTQYIEEAIEEYKQKYQKIEASKENKRFINTVEFAEFIFNKEKSNQIKIIDSIQEKIDSIEKNIIDKIKSFGLIHSQSKNFIEKPKFLDKVFNRNISKEYNSQLQDINNLKFKIEKLENIEKNIRYGNFGQVFKSFLVQREKLNNLKFNSEKIINNNNGIKNNDSFLKLYSDEIKLPDLLNLFPLNKFKEIEKETILCLNNLVTNLNEIKSKNIISKSEKFDNIKKESDNILDKALLGIVKPIYFSIENIKKSFNEITDIEKITIAVFIASLSTITVDASNLFFKDKPAVNSIVQTTTQVNNLNTLVIEGGSSLKDMYLKTNFVQSREQIKHFVEYLEKDNQQLMINEIDKNLKLISSENVTLLDEKTIENKNVHNVLDLDKLMHEALLEDDNKPIKKTKQRNSEEERI